MTQYQLEVAINEVKAHYQAQMEKKMQIIRQNVVQRIKHENEIMLIKATNCTLQGEVEHLKQQMNEELLPLLKQHADLRAQNEANNHLTE